MSIFDELTERRGTGSYKWDSYDNNGLIPMWVADMDFRTTPAVTEAVVKRAEQGIFGYTLVGEEYYSAVRDWFAKRHQWHIDTDMLIYTSGVVPAVSAIIKAMTQPGDKVIVQTPA
ncbi:MAG: cystathionine beta-lyase, partial [Muribaculaceae bacterium]|nr:cystathionine beta-lyase [Muribaculaceae bacterium]